ncbi:unnamed protein product [Prorocentrum cordatum]|uniref:Sel1 repeat family protein n=1 Tax=Prorocentrum cordatum TaxID=2364126 RepID=A0ABN9TAW0_9DINO|nr:unnamed protein product [Polarella glacialis]
MLRLLALGVAALLLLLLLLLALRPRGVPAGPPELSGDVGAPLGAVADDRSLLRQGAAAFRRGDDATAVRCLHACLSDTSAPLDTRAACKTVLGEMHLVGAGVPKNLTEAWALFQAAADAGDAEAQFNLALLYSAVHAEGDDVFRREALAVL